jgi:hypothetical protein
MSAARGVPLGGVAFWATNEGGVDVGGEGGVPGEVAFGAT